MGYYKVSDGEKMKVGRNGLVRMKCCDCSLIHLLRFTIIDNKVVIEAWRDEKATRKARLRKK